MFITTARRTRRHPWADLHDFNRTFRSFFHELDKIAETRHAARSAYQPPFNLYESEESYRLKALVPGLDRESLKVTIHEGKLLVEGSRKTDTPEGYKALRQERAAWSFSRTLKVPADVDVETITASLEHGVLEVKLPRQPQAQARKIEVTVA